MSKDIYKIAKGIGLRKKEINSILKKISDTTEDTNFSVGPSCYPGHYYGCLSIKDF
jgi:hypothetical protein